MNGDWIVEPQDWINEPKIRYLPSNPPPRVCEGQTANQSKARTRVGQWRREPNAGSWARNGDRGAEYTRDNFAHIADRKAWPAKVQAFDEEYAMARLRQASGDVLFVGPQGCIPRGGGYEYEVHGASPCRRQANQSHLP